jgi:four helix bundle protein
MGLANSQQPSANSQQPSASSQQPTANSQTNRLQIIKIEFSRARFNTFARNILDMKNFKKLLVWNKSVELALNVYDIADKLPKDERFGLISQMKRACVSISSNIAEGASRRTDIEKARFTEIALGSAFELETQLIIAKRKSLVSPEEADCVLQEIVELEKSLNSFYRKLRSGL